MAESNAGKIVLGPDCWIKGELHIGGDLQLHGTCEGTLHVGGTLDLQPTATLTGLARAGAVRVAGRVDGDLVGEQGIALLDGCHVSGRIFSTRLLAVKGATLQALVCIGPEALAQSPGQKLAQSSAAQSTAAPSASEREEDAISPFADEAVAQHEDDGRDMMNDSTAQKAGANESADAATIISIAAALDDADEVSAAEPQADVPDESEEPAAEALADISTVPHSIRSVLQRRPRLTSLASPPRRTG